MCDHQIEPAIVIIINPCGPGAPGVFLSANPSRLRYILKSPIAPVAEEMIGADAGDEKVGAAVVVKITRRHRHALELHVQVRPCSDVAEVSVPIVAKESETAATHPFHHRFFPRPGRPVDKQQIGRAIPVVIQHGYRTTERSG